jgi:pimeloyl-ACP methyl ester carboxylesterase
MWLLGRRFAAADPTDMIRTIEAEDVQDGSLDLPRITAPTLVIGGDRDRYYGAANFRATAELIPGARLRLYPGKGHYGWWFTGRRSRRRSASSRSEPSRPRSPGYGLIVAVC